MYSQSMIKICHGLRFYLNTNNMDSVKVKSKRIICRRKEIKGKCREGRYQHPHLYSEESNDLNKKKKSTCFIKFTKLPNKK